MDLQLQLLQNYVLETESHIIYIITRIRNATKPPIFTPK
jgi:hypothetical protein